MAGIAGLFFSLYILISHDDLDSKIMQPMELSDIMKAVSELFWLILIVDATGVGSFRDRLN